MPEFRKFPSIEQFRHVVKSVQKLSKGSELPTLSFLGTVKLHGTNSAIGYDPLTRELWAQSRERIITPDNDNFGFAAFVESNKEEIIEAIEENTPTEDLDRIWIYGEWCGQGIQKGVGISNLPKMFVIFETVFGDDSFREDSLFLRGAVGNIFSIEDFPSFSIDIDFNNPELSVERLIELTTMVEESCPVAARLGSLGIGEGIVWHHFGVLNEHLCRLIFKVKGDKHASSKVKKLAAVDVEKLNSINEFIEYSVTESRLNQALTELSIEKGDKSKTGDFVRWIANDIIKEESDTLESNNLQWKDVASKASKKASKWFLESL